jgi:hypothetical protein
MQRRGVDNPNVSAETTLNSGDQLIFAGDVEKLVDLFMISGIKPTNQVPIHAHAPHRRTAAPPYHCTRTRHSGHVLTVLPVGR